MTARMAILQKEFKGFPDFRSVSVTTDPDVDTIDAIKKFASLHHADLSSWYFLRGTKEQMIALSSGGLGLGGEMKTPAHSVQFALVDKTGKIRGRFDPRVPNEMKELQKNVRELLSGKQ
jgi:protein SCO1/2